MIQPRLGFLLAALAITTWASFRAAITAAPVEIAEPTSPKSVPASSSLAQRSRVSIGAATSDPFFGPTPKAWARPPVAAAVPNPPPSAPPLPFGFLGRTTGPDGQTQVFLTRGGDLLTVHERDVLDGQYRVERIANDEVVFVYLPLAQAQTLRVQP